MHHQSNPRASLDRSMTRAGQTTEEHGEQTPSHKFPVKLRWRLCEQQYIEYLKRISNKIELIPAVHSCFQ